MLIKTEIFYKDFLIGLWCHLCLKIYIDVYLRLRLVLRLVLPLDFFFLFLPKVVCLTLLASIVFLLLRDLWQLLLRYPTDRATIHGNKKPLHY